MSHALELHYGVGVLRRLGVTACAMVIAACASAPADVGAPSRAPVTPPGSVAATAATADPTNSTSSTSSTSTTVVTTTTLPPRTLTLIAGGDVLNEGWVDQAGRTAAGPGQRFDFVPLFAPVAPIIGAADLAICHAELPIGRPDQSSGVYGRSDFGGNLLLAPFEIAPALAATGFDRCSTASNHAYDLGAAGIESTLDALDAAGISHVGTARTEDEARTPLVDIAGVAVGHLSFTKNWNTVPPAGWMLRRATSATALADEVDLLRAQGAEIVVVSLHVGKELLTGPTDADRQFVEELIAAAPIDLVLMHGPHVVQPYEFVGSTPVYWSLGNFVSGMGRPGTGRYEDLRTLDGLLASVRFTERADGSFEADPQAVLICNEQQSRVVRAPIRELAAEAAGQLPQRLRDELEACIDRTRSVEPDIG
ncbi:MAG: Capsule biosynthesis protein CapA [Actinomycetota bacterium]